MELNIYVNNSEKNKLGKSLSNKVTLNGHLKEETSIIEPIIKVDISNPSKYNYCYIPQFNRYYFIKDINNINANIWELHLHVDVLESYKSNIKKLNAIIEKNQYRDNSNKYFNDGQTFFYDSKETNEIANFSNGFDSSTHYILITAGA